MQAQPPETPIISSETPRSSSLYQPETEEDEEKAAELDDSEISEDVAEEDEDEIDEEISSS